MIPMDVPRNMEISVARMPTIREIRAPESRFLKISRPRLSVPEKYVVLGGCRMVSTVPNSMGLYGNSTGPITAATEKNNRIPAPVVAIRLFLKPVQKRSSFFRLISR
jgi:hypothetical protein